MNSEANSNENESVDPIGFENDDKKTIDRLMRENEHLKSKIEGLEADKSYFMEELKNRDQMLSQTNELLSNALASRTQDQKNQKADESNLESRTRKGFEGVRSPNPVPTTVSNDNLAVPVTDQPIKKSKPKVDWTPKKPSQLADATSDSGSTVDETSADEQPSAYAMLGEFISFNSVLIGRVALSLAIIVIAIYFVSRGLNEDQTVDSNQAQSSEIVNDDLARHSFSHLTSESNLRVDDTSLSIPVRFDNAKRRIKIADMLLEKEQNREAQIFGTRSKIEALTRLGMLSLQHEITDNQTLLDLGEIADANIEHPVKKIAARAHAAKATSSVWGYFQESTNSSETETPSDSTKQMRTKAIEDFEAATRFLSEDLTNALTLFELATSVNDEKRSNSIPELLELISDVWSTSEQEAIRNLATEAVQRHMVAVQPLTNVAGAVDAQTDAMVTKLSSELQTLLDLPDLKAFQYPRISRRIAGVIQNGRFEDAQRMIEQTLEKIGETEVLQPVRMELENMQTRTRLIGTSISIDGLSELDGTQAVFRPDVTVKLILFISTENYRQCVQRLNSLASVIDKLLEETKVSISIVYQDDGSDPEQLKRLGDLKRHRSELDVWKIDLDSTAGQRFLNRFPISKTPFLIILNGRNELVALDPPGHSVLSDIFEFLE